MVVMSMEGHDVFSKVTGGRPVFTSEAVGGGAPGPVPQERETGGGAFPRNAAALEVTRPEPRNQRKDFMTRT